MNENQFTELYQSYSSAMLLEIIEKSREYQALAVEAARTELARRESLGEDLEQAQMEFETKKSDAERKREKTEGLKRMIISTGKSLFYIVSPLITLRFDQIKPFLIISVFLVIVSVINLYRIISAAWFIFGIPPEFFLSGMSYILQLLIIPAITVLFLMRKQLGWPLAAMYFSFYSMGTAILLVMELFRKPSEFLPYEELFRPTSPYIYSVQLVFYGWMIWLLCRKSVTAVYRIDRIIMLVSIGAGLFLAFAGLLYS